nr:osmoprotectant ABC transporter substrate-binding protein [uncultured Bacillus sp.]
MHKLKKSCLLIVLSFSLLLSACSLPGLSGSPEDTVRIGTLNTSESQIMGQMIRQLIEHYTDLEVVMVNNLGTSTVAHQAMVDGQIDISSTRYTGTDLTGALQLEPEKDPHKAMEIIQREFQKRWDQTWLDSYGFENSYDFAVTEELAEKLHLEKVSDLQPYTNELSFGVDNSWIHRKGDGYQGFTDMYGFEFPNIYPMQIGLVYQALDTGDMDVVLAYSSDGRISSFDLKILEDDKQFFPPYDTSMVVRNELFRNNPELEEILPKLSGTISTERMQELNYEADGKMREPAVIAKEFLEENNYFEEVE